MLDTALTLLQRAHGPAGWYASLTAAIVNHRPDDVPRRLRQLVDLALDTRTPGQALRAIARALPLDRPELTAIVVEAAHSLPPGTSRVELLTGEPGFDRDAALHELANRAGDGFQGQLLALARLLEHLVQMGEIDVASRWAGLLEEVGEAAPIPARAHAHVVAARVHAAGGNDVEAVRALGAVMALVRDSQDLQTASWPAARLFGVLARGLVEPARPMLAQLMDHIGDWPPENRNRFVRGICEGLPGRGIPLAEVAVLFDGLDLSLEAQAIVEAQLAVEEARMGHVQGCVHRLERGLELRAHGSPVELQDVVGDLPSAAPLASIASGLAEAGVLAEAAPILGAMARQAPKGEETLRWIDAWSVALARNGYDDELLLDWLATARQMVDEVDLPDLPHIPLETLGTLAVLEIQRGDPGRGEWQLRGLERRARPPTNHVLASRRIRALATVGRLDALAEAARLPDHVRAMLAEDLVAEGLPGPAAEVLDGLSSSWVERVFNAAEARCNHHETALEGWADLVEALEPNLGLVSSHGEFRCQVILARLRLLTDDADPGRVALRRLAIRAMEHSAPAHLYMLFLAVMDAVRADQ
jgi:hypothetical protein